MRRCVALNTLQNLVLLRTRMVISAIDINDISTTDSIIVLIFNSRLSFLSLTYRFRYCIVFVASSQKDDNCLISLFESSKNFLVAFMTNAKISVLKLRAAHDGSISWEATRHTAYARSPVPYKKPIRYRGNFGEQWVRCSLSTRVLELCVR